MKINDMFEGINMGKSALRNKPKHEYTVGYEFELALYSGYDTDYSWMEDVRREFDNDDTYDRQHFPRFIENFFKNYFTSSSFNLKKFIEEYDFIPEEPLRSYDEYIAQKKDDFESQYGIGMYDKCYAALKKIDNTDRPTDAMADQWFEDVEMVQDFFNTTGVIDDIPTVTEKNIKQYSRKIFDIAMDMGFETTWWSGLTKKYNSDIFIEDMNGGIHLPSYIDDIDTFLHFFDVEKSDFIDATQSLWEDDEAEFREDIFERWVEWKYPDGIGGIEFVKNKLKGEGYDVGDDHYRFTVVPDGTPGVDAEITTPIAPYNKAIRYMHEICSMISVDDYMHTTNKCGVHINIGTFQNHEDVDWLKFLLIYNPKLVLAEFDRIGNHYTPDHTKNYIDALKNNNLDDYYNATKISNSIIMTKATKMSAVNFEKLSNANPHIEIRAPGGENYEEKTDKIEEYTLRAIRALDIARDHNAYRNEYLKMLYKIFGNKDYTDYIKEYFDNIGIPFDRYGIFASLRAIIEEYPEYSKNAASFLNKNTLDAIEEYYGDGMMFQSFMKRNSDLEHFPEAVNNPLFRNLLRRFGLKPSDVLN